MRHRVLATMVCVCLFGAGAAYAAGPVTGSPNSYTAAFAVAGATGSAARPAPAALTETLGMSNMNSSDVGAPLVSIKTTTYGVKAPNAARFPTCSVAKISANNGNNGKWNAVCPKGSRPYSASFAATESNTGSPTMAQATVKGTAKC